MGNTRKLLGMGEESYAELEEIAQSVRDTQRAWAELKDFAEGKERLNATPWLQIRNQAQYKMEDFVSEWSTRFGKDAEEGKTVAMKVIADLHAYKLVLPVVKFIVGDGWDPVTHWCALRWQHRPPARRRRLDAPPGLLMRLCCGNPCDSPCALSDCFRVERALYVCAHFRSVHVLPQEGPLHDPGPAPRDHDRHAYPGALRHGATAHSSTKATAHPSTHWPARSPLQPRIRRWVGLQSRRRARDEKTPVSYIRR